MEVLETNFLDTALPEDLKTLLSHCLGWERPGDRAEILQLALGDAPAEQFEVAYVLPGPDAW